MQHAAHPQRLRHFPVMGRIAEHHGTAGVVPGPPQVLQAQVHFAFGVNIAQAQQFVKIPHLDAIWIVSVILMAAALMIMISMRVESMAYILGSDLENDNPIAKPALNNFFAGAAIALVGIIAAVVAAFSSTVKEEASA